ncbi:MAG: papain-like cysteine protease family protein [Acidobacteriota bacterium]
MAATKTKKTTRKTKTTSSANDLTEKLDFTVAEPLPTPRLSLHRQYGAQFADGCWMLEPGGAMQFRLQVAEPEHMIFALEMHSSLDAWIEKLAQRMSASKTPVLEWLCYTPDSYNPVMLTVGDQDLADNLHWEGHLNPLGAGFSTKRMILAPAHLFPGENFVTLWLSSDPGTVPLYLKSVSVSDFRLQRQQQTQWCWAAVTSSMMEFMAPERAASQSEVAAHTLNPTSAQSAEELNRPEDITKAARTMGLDEGTRYGNVSRDTMRWLVNAGTPIPIQINWRNNARKNGSLGGAHYIVVNAIGDEAKGKTLVDIEDPWVGQKLTLTWDELKNDYPGKRQDLYKHKDRQKCPDWKDGGCQCQWRGKWTYTHMLTPKEWSEDEYDEAEYKKLLESVDQRLVELAERDGSLDDFEKFVTTFEQKPKLEEVTARIHEFNHQLVQLDHQIQDLQIALAQFRDLQQSLLEKPSGDE